MTHYSNLVKPPEGCKERLYHHVYKKLIALQLWIYNPSMWIGFGDKWVEHPKEWIGNLWEDLSEIHDKSIRDKNSALAGLNMEADLLEAQLTDSLDLPPEEQRQAKKDFMAGVS